MADLQIDCIIGIDPGASGGIALWKPNAAVKVYKMPKDLYELVEFWEHVKTIAEHPIIFIEKVQLRMDDMQGGKAFRIQEMLKGFETLKTIITLSKIPFVQVHPMSWQSTLHLRKKGEEKEARKNRYKDVAAKFYPEVKPTLWSADALLILHFGRTKKMNDPDWILENLPEKTHSNFMF